jgi:uncharacterized membrane protein YphA (DoxX/SURF4 family)
MEAIAHSPEPPPSVTRAAVLRTIAFRFAFVYWLVMFVVMSCSEDNGINLFGKVLRPVWNPIAAWVGKHVLGISYEMVTAITGSTDRTIDWVGVFIAAVSATIATVVWTITGQRAARHARLRAALRVLVRYVLAFALLGYGTGKLFCLQFSPPSTGRLLQPIGDASPMGFLWTFMGASSAYQFFAGLAETVAALLLLFRRTTTLGALMLSAVLVNVVLLNLCYDVCVKLNAMHYLAMCIFLLLPMLGRLAVVILFHRGTQPIEPEPIWPVRWQRIAGQFAKHVMIAVMITHDMQDCLHWLQLRDATRPWYDGIWRVTTFTRDGQMVPSLTTDATRWLRIKFEADSDSALVRWRYMEGSYGDLYDVAVDEKQQVMTFTVSHLEKPKEGTGTVTFHYIRSDGDHLMFEGKVGTATLSVQTERVKAGQTMLRSRGFHWISEEPFSR